MEQLPREQGVCLSSWVSYPYLASNSITTSRTRRILTHGRKKYLVLLVSRHFRRRPSNEPAGQVYPTTHQVLRTRTHARPLLLFPSSHSPSNAQGFCQSSWHDSKPGRALIHRLSVRLELFLSPSPRARFLARIQSRCVDVYLPVHRLPLLHMQRSRTCHELSCSLSD
ncbi:hypothetical protein CTAM01_06653 [Colletotrichum tamarilloi]|uniref:Uncharacterized protein n=1 Tax=Colletotrichum tamarilloi TaxID=1209934 RepID=A0ABQ9RAR6_9PEZI|nr:uncharacterized protein CTAM01_06653 [Colletotrichum tamarilloi]KAK1500054.1 hypothetical protein CTAM01_06653 [Colletotrichum tamarilloi]